MVRVGCCCCCVMVAVVGVVPVLCWRLGGGAMVLGGALEHADWCGNLAFGVGEPVA